MSLAARAPRVLSVGQLVARVRDLLEADIGAVWVAGEISNLHRSAAGHCYFTLKDDDAQLACAMFRMAAQQLTFRLTDGAEVVVCGRPSVYPARGTLQLIVQSVEPRGLGALQLAFEQLKARLQAEGLFDAARKRPLPRCPETIGIVTALGGAVIHDMRTVLRARWPHARVVVRPVPVQGRDAAPAIAAALGEIAQVPGMEVVIVGRGGGSLEDLWAFNEEVVARAIAACPVPVVSAVGHEVDFTIADFVADLRAPTPTAAAALVSPDAAELRAAVAASELALRRALHRRVADARRDVERLGRALGDPRRRVRDYAQRVDELADRLRRGVRHTVRWEGRSLATLADRLRAAVPGAQVARARERTDALAARLVRAMRRCTEQGRAAVARVVPALHALSPLACLDRGYAIVRRDAAGGAVARDAGALVPGERVTLLLHRGRARAVIEGRED